MPSRRIACLLLGLWLGAGVWMQWVAPVNLKSANDALLRPTGDAANYLKSLGNPPLGPLAHYLAAEQNRSLWETWGIVQVVASALFFFFLLFGTRVGKVPVILGLLMVLVALLERAVVIPEMSAVGRITDFAADPSHRVRLAYVALNYGYMASELVKWLLAAGLAAFLIFEPGRRSFHSRQQLNMVDKTNYRHIDG